MIDFVKFHIPIKYKESIVQKLKLKGSVCLETGEIEQEIALYKNMKFLIRSSYIEVTGSFHTYFNDGHHNYNDFCFSDVKKTIISFCIYFGISPNKCYLKNLEVGFNISPSIRTSDLLDSIILYKNKEPMIDRTSFKYFLEFKAQRYFIKIYDKGLQNKLVENRLRVEVKFMKMQELKVARIETLNDLLIKSSIEWLTKQLLRRFNKVLMFDYKLRFNVANQCCRARINELNILCNGSNPRYWIKEKKLLKSTTYYKRINRFKALRNKYNQNSYHSLICTLLKEKRKELLR